MPAKRRNGPGTRLGGSVAAYRQSTTEPGPFRLAGSGPSGPPFCLIARRARSSWGCSAAPPDPPRLHYPSRTALTAENRLPTLQEVDEYGPGTWTQSRAIEPPGSPLVVSS